MLFILAGIYRLPRLASSCTERSRVTRKGFPFACKSTKNAWSLLCARRTCVFTRGYSARVCQVQIELYRIITVISDAFQVLSEALSIYSSPVTSLYRNVSKQYFVHTARIIKFVTIGTRTTCTYSVALTYQRYVSWTAYLAHT